MGWLYLIIAGFFEVGFTTLLKLSDNFSKVWPTIGFITLAFLSFLFLSLSLKFIPMGTAYAVWTGIGAFGTALVGVLCFGEPISFWRIFLLCCLVGSVVGLKFASDY